MKHLAIEIRFMLKRIVCLIVSHRWTMRRTALADLYRCERCELRYHSIWHGGPGRRSWWWWR